MGVPSCRLDYASHILLLADLVEALDLLGCFDRLSALLTRVSSPTRGPCSTRPPWQRRGPPRAAA